MNAVLDLLIKTITISGQGQRTFWMPEKASTYAGKVDDLFYFILWLSVFFFVLIVGLMLYFIIAYRRRSDGEKRDSGPTHNTALEVVWTAIPVILVVVIFAWGFLAFMDMKIAPMNAYEIQVNGMKWKWSFTYPNGYSDENLHVPVNRPIRLVITSSDVIHSVYIPAFRLKMDAVPGRYHSAWFEATKTGDFHLFCAEYCGTQHSDMMARVVVHPPGEFEKWLEDASNFLATLPPEEAGQKLYQIKGCAQCHSVDGKIVIGPSFLNVFGTTHPLKDGSNVTVEENYIRESILNPQAKIVAGYDPVMPTYKGRLKDEEISAIIQYIKSLAQGKESQ